MKPVRIRGELLEGHKGAAVEVPFDPSARWKREPSKLWKGRRGHPVRARLGGVEFESAIVPRSKRFWLLVDAAVLSKTGRRVGDVLQITIEPDLPISTSRNRAKSV